MKNAKCKRCNTALCVIIIIAGIQAANYVNKKGTIWASRCLNDTFESVKTIDADAFEYKLREGCYHLIETEGKFGSMTISNYKTIYDYLIRDRSFSELGYGEYAILMHYAYLYSQQRSDKEMTKLIIDKFDDGFRDGCFLERQDQMAYGSVAIDLYKETGDIFYKQFAYNLYARLDSIYQKEGIVLYRNGSQVQHVDVIGLVCPFLYYYAQSFNNPRAKQIADKMINEYIRWGTDDVTGLPVQTYGIGNHVKMNHCNWGRGISWFLMGIMDYSRTDSAMNYRISTLENTLLSEKRLLYNQYFSQGEIPDMSATIPVLYYLYTKQLLHITRSKMTQLISPYCDNDGILRYCSPSISNPHEGVSATIRSLPSQGILLFLLAILK